MPRFLVNIFLSIMITFSTILFLPAQALAGQIIRINLSSPNTNLVVGESIRLEAVGYDTAGSPTFLEFPSITYDSLDHSIGIVNSNGNFTALADGQTQVFAQLGGTAGASPGLMSNMLDLTVVAPPIITNRITNRNSFRRVNYVVATSPRITPPPPGTIETPRPNLLPDTEPSDDDPTDSDNSQQNITTHIQEFFKKHDIHTKSDADGDGISDIAEINLGTNPYQADSDQDGVDDYTEIMNGRNPKDKHPLFHDLKKIPWAKDSILSLVSRGIINGYSDRTFKPDKAITRAELLKIILGARNASLKSYNPLQFNDINPSSWQAKYVSWAKNHNIIRGYADGSFKPNQAVTRAEALKIILDTFELNDTSLTYPTFTDVSGWVVPYAETARQYGIVHGYSDGTFHPDQLITRAEASKILAGILQSI